MALFFDQEWFDARLRERGLNKAALASLLRISSTEVDDMWKDQREISPREVTLLAELLGVSNKEIARRGGAATPNPDEASDVNRVLTRLDALDARIARLERGVADILAQLAAQKPGE